MIKGIHIDIEWKKGKGRFWKQVKGPVCKRKNQGAVFTAQGSA